MSLELIREAIKVNEVLGEDLEQTVVENDIIVPDIKPDITKVLLLDCDVSVNSSETLQDKLVVSATIRYKILYISDDPEQKIKSINIASGYSYTVDIPGAKPGMNSKARCEVEHVEYEILNGRKVNVKAILRQGGNVQNELEQGAVSDLTGVDDIQVMKKNITINSYLGKGEDVSKVSDVLEIPAGKPTIRELLRNDVKITGKDYRIGDNKVIAKGNINISTLYVGDDENGSLQFIENEIPFAQSVELPGVNENSVCELNLDVNDFSFEAAEDNDGELRALKCDVEVHVTVDGYSKNEVEVVEDAYSPSSRLEIEKEPFKVEEFISENRNQIVIKDTVPVEYGAEILEVFNVLSKPYLSQFRIENDKVILEGAVSNKVLYLANNDEQPVDCLEQDTPMNQVLDIKGIRPGMGCEIDLDIEHCTYSMLSSREVEVRIVLYVNIRVVKLSVQPLIKRVNQTALDPAVLSGRPSIVIYFAQPGDTLWNVAKRYYTTINDVAEVNELDENNALMPGQQLIIPAKRL